MVSCPCLKGTSVCVQRMVHGGWGGWYTEDGVDGNIGGGIPGVDNHVSSYLGMIRIIVIWIKLTL